MRLTRGNKGRGGEAVWPREELAGGGYGRGTWQGEEEGDMVEAGGGGHGRGRGRGTW